MVDMVEEAGTNCSGKQTGKRVEFLIAAHKDPKILKALCRALDYEYFDIYVHIDKRSDITLFDTDNYNLKYSKLYVLKDRINVRWGDVSQVDAALKMYEQALNNYDYCRYVTLSGLDFPIKSNEEIYKTLIKSDIGLLKEIRSRRKKNIK